MKTGNNATIATIFNRRSSGKLNPPGPSEAELITILRAGAAAPDHKLTRPFWFIVFEGDARLEFGEVLAESMTRRSLALGIEPTQGQITKEKTKFLRAPLVIAVAAKKHPEIVLPDEELICAGAAAAQNMLLAATSFGYGSMWRSGDVLFDPFIKEALGLAKTDYLIGFLYFGSYKDGITPEPNDPELSDIVSKWES
ncbi:nitroreductase [Acidithrix sp. C25]|uniref:nitroreductase family protein n=1 Tax=Acidithrix sp. C25 TaxID=1671482 RepID=UPI00191BBDD1|nr:nitroreductase [Acidithrix sp. C25]CAG4925138.1 unnamed protein product [Acidithrix sp. C25]